MEKLKLTNENLMAFIQDLTDDFDPVFADPQTEEQIDAACNFIDYWVEQLAKTFDIPSWYNPDTVIQDIMEGNDVSYLCAKSYGQENDTESEDDSEFHLITVKGLKEDTLKFADLDKTPEIKKNLFDCITSLESIDETTFDTFKEILLSAKPYSLKGGSISAVYKMTGNSRYKVKPGYFMAEIRIQSNTSAKYRAYGGFKNLDSPPVTLYIIDTYRKNAGQAQADDKFDALLRQFNNEIEKLEDSYMGSRWVPMKELLRDFTLTEKLQLAEELDEIEKQKPIKGKRLMSDEAINKVFEYRQKRKEYKE